MFSLHDAICKMILNIEAIDVHILQAVMVDWIMSETESRFVFTSDDDRSLIHDFQVVEDIFNPHCVVNSFQQSSEFCLSTGLGDNALFFTSPCDWIASKNGAISRR